MGEIQYQRSAHNAIDYVWILWLSA